MNLLLLLYAITACAFTLGKIQSPLAAGSSGTSFQTARLADIQQGFHDDFATFSHPSFPQHGLRIKKIQDFCDSTVNVYSGYLDFTSAGSKHLFFWFFESRSDPATDDVIMWINGGPGGSSGFGAFMELGPCSIDLHAEKGNTNRTVWNPYGWNTNANIFFLEQPVGVGFSYADFGTHIHDTVEAARDVNAFVNIFFDVFDEFKGRAFHLAGESYGGRYVPLFASEIYDGKKKALEEGRTPVNLQSILIGNGISAPHDVIASSYDILCTTASGHAPVLGVDTCVQIRKSLPYCKRMLQEGCVDRLDATECSAAQIFCESLFYPPMTAQGLNPYDTRKKCTADNQVCYAEVDAIEEWLNLNTTRKQLGIPESVPAYSAINLEVNSDFAASSDVLQRSDFHVAQLLERGVRALIYVGVADAVCPWTGNMRSFEALEWTGQEAFVGASTGEWNVSVDAAESSRGSRQAQVYKAVGSIKSAKGLTFLTVNEAGHMVPYDQPEVSLAMLQAWLRKELV